MTDAILSTRGPALSWARRYPALVALVLLFLFDLAFTPHFVSWQTLNVNLTQVATIVIVAVGMTLVIATGGIDLSVGSLMAIAGALAPMIFLQSARASPSRARRGARLRRPRRGRRAPSASSTAGSSPASTCSRSSAR